jgi:hypothetical protein
MMWVGGFMVAILAWIANRFVVALDGVKEEIHQMRVSFERLPTLDEVKEEAKRTASEAVTKHEKIMHYHEMNKEPS